MFELTKWYFDVVGGQGRSAIACWSTLRWGPLAVRWEGLSLHQPGVPPVHRSGVGNAAGPVRVSPLDSTGPPGEITWSSRSLSLDVRCQPWTKPFGARLLQTDEGALDWRCEAPAADVSVATGDGLRLAGDGYAECLVLTLPPWKLPISELRWGRWASSLARRSVVWLDWRGPQPLTLVLVDGVPAADARVEDDRIRIGSSELLLSDTQTLHARALADILDGLGPVAGRVPASWRAVEDRKSLSLGCLRSAAGSRLEGCWPGAGTGWAIHETVRFP